MLTDAFGRTFPYLRLSVTEACNFRCTYCLPDGYKKTHAGTFLSREEIRRLVTGFADLGTRKVRLTGGEPSVRPDLADIARDITDLGRIETLALTTNGYNLKQKARAFAESGITALNVSIDSLSTEKFHRITGHDKLRPILDGLEAARKWGIRRIKVNCVLLKGVNDDEWDGFLRFAREQALSLRFIELMQTGENADYFHSHHVRSEELETRLIEAGYVLRERRADDGPAREYVHPDTRGSIGVIAPYSKDFCTTCNRLRVTARGQLRLCLFGEFGQDLRPLLSDDAQRDGLKGRIIQTLGHKLAAHNLKGGQTGLTPHFASVGG